MLALVGAACGATVNGASTTTTTTIPTPVGVAATTPTGPFGSFGTVERVPVFTLGAGINTVPVGPGGIAPTTGTVKVAFRQFGHGPNLLLAMGQRGSMSWWDPQLLTDLSAKFRVTIFDYPDIGYSAISPTNPTIEGYGDQIAGLIVALNLDNPVVLGWGLGGEVALSFAERHVGLYAGLVLVDSTAGGPTAHPPTRAVARIVSSPLSTMTRLATQMFPATQSTAASAWLERIDQLAPDDVVRSAIDAQAKAQALFFSDTSVEKMLGTIAVPTLIVAGADDVVIPASNSSELAHAIAGAELRIFPGSGYAALAQDESAFVNDVGTFAQATFASTTTTTTATATPG